jgi:hypothetical protein
LDDLGFHRVEMMLVVMRWEDEIWWNTLKAVRVETDHGVFIKRVYREGLF